VARLVDPYTLHGLVANITSFSEVNLNRCRIIGPSVENWRAIFAADKKCILTRSKVVSRKVLNGLKRNASLSKGLSNTAEIFVSRSLELPVHIFAHSYFRKCCVMFTTVCIQAHGEKSCISRTRVLFGSREVSLERIFNALSRKIIFYVIILSFLGKNPISDILKETHLKSCLFSAWPSRARANRKLKNSPGPVAMGWCHLSVRLLSSQDFCVQWE